MSDIRNESGLDIDGFMSAANEYLDGNFDPDFKFYTDEVFDQKVRGGIEGEITSKKEIPLDAFIEIINDIDKKSFMQAFLDPERVGFQESNSSDSIEIRFLKAYKLERDINKKSDYTKLITDFFGEGVSELAKIAEILTYLGFNKSSVTVLALLSKLTHARIKKPITEEIIKRTTISDKNRIAGKGNVNKNKELVIKIAKKTWEKYPSASVGGLRDEIYEYLTRNNITARPSMATINDWLKKSKDRPSVIKPNRDFVLITD